LERRNYLTWATETSPKGSISTWKTITPEEEMGPIPESLERQSQVGIIPGPPKTFGGG